MKGTPRAWFAKHPYCQLRFRYYSVCQPSSFHVPVVFGAERKRRREKKRGEVGALWPRLTKTLDLAHRRLHANDALTAAAERPERKMRLIPLQQLTLGH